MQYMAHSFGGEVKEGKTREYGDTEVFITEKSPLFEGLSDKEITLMSHTDYVAVIPEGFKVTAKMANCPTVATENIDKKLFAVQFHPEVKRTINFKKILENFVKIICNAKCDYSLDDYIETQVKEIRKQVGDKKVLLGLSGGVDSSVAAALIGKAIPNQLLCVYIDHGFMRKNETEEIRDAFKDMPISLKKADSCW